MHRKNLAGLAVLLREQAKAEHFDMCDFGAGSPKGITPEALNVCGTVACALGYAPLLFPAEHDEGWGSYCQRVFGLPLYSQEGYFLFAASWWDTDNTPEGAAKRIDYLLKHGCPSNEDMNAMIDGKKELCYE